MPGIEKLKESITSIVNFFVALVVLIKQKKGLWYIITTIAPKAIKLKGIITDFSAIKLEYSDLDDAEREALKQHFKDTLNVDNDKAEQLAEIWFGVAVDIEAAIQRTIQLTK